MVFNGRTTQLRLGVIGTRSGMEPSDFLWNFSAHISTASTPKDASLCQLYFATASARSACVTSPLKPANGVSPSIPLISSNSWSGGCKRQNVKAASRNANSPTSWRRFHNHRSMLRVESISPSTFGLFASIDKDATLIGAANHIAVFPAETHSPEAALDDLIDVSDLL